ncbi:DUF423 domain-containing protein [Saccharobesus litoralis]|uniref:DUF423 domain-containing protein n=1 Tax=Saccharobesus litoralis TaxID=2172099 RepID=A0A2S0VUH0_9ALTE|nr:DUF423 domain-containing protein [Saccharobesus litoralis]AWB67812.1 DUF423 domain-containing protein [Saccharobesus litoralis]
MFKYFFALACVLGGLAVVIGAFAAHGLKQVLDEYALGIIATGVQYQFFHSLLLALVAFIMKSYKSRCLTFIASLLVIGIVLFAGSLYALALTPYTWFGPVTPLGGLCFIIAWFSLAWFGVKKL